jgi:hypothetical protein
MDKKFVLKDATVEDQKAFGEGLNELCNKLGLTFNIGIVKQVLNVKGEDGKNKSVFVDEPTVLLQKKVTIPDTSEPKITDVKAEPTISPFISQPNTDENKTDTTA